MRFNVPNDVCPVTAMVFLKAVDNVLSEELKVSVYSIVVVFVTFKFVVVAGQEALCSYGGFKIPHDFVSGFWYV